MGSLPQLSILRGSTRKFTPDTINHLIEEVATKDAANNTALVYEDEGNLIKYSYYELNSIATKISAVLKGKILTHKLPRNVDGDYLISVNLHPSDKLVLVLLAIWKAGAAYLPLDHGFPASRIQHILSESRPAIVITDEVGNDENYIGAHRICLEDLLREAASISEDACLQEKLYNREDLAIVLYTSGSTGIPKGVRLAHKTILNRLNWQFKAFPYSKTEEVCIFKTALTFVDSVAELWGPLTKGLTILVVSKSYTKDPEKFVFLLEKYRVERIVLVPSLLRSILMYMQMQKKTILQHLKTWVCSGEILSVSLSSEFFKYFPENQHQLCNFYGSTEIMGDVTYHVITGPNQLKYQEKVPIGLPVDNTIIYLLDSDYRPVKSGEVGELFVAGLNVASGYVNGRDPDKFLDNPLAIDPAFAKLYRTGDFARMAKDTLIYEGRTDSQVKIRGHRVDLSEVEKAVNDLEAVSKAIVLCYKAGEMNQALLAFVTTDKLVNEYQIEANLKNKISAYMVPQVILIENIPLLVNGKIDRQALLKSYENTNNNDDEICEVEIDYSGVQNHQMQAANILFETVASVLGRSARGVVSKDANFYEIGGNSLNSIYTISKLNESGYRISIGDFIAAVDLEEVLQRMTTGTLVNTKPLCYTAHKLEEKYKDSVVELQTTCFYRKAELERYIQNELSENEYREFVQDIWPLLVEKDLSFCVKNQCGKMVGACFAFDYNDEPEMVVTTKLSIVMEYLEHIEVDVREKLLPKEKGKIYHCFMIGTDSSLSTKENIAVIQFLEEEVTRLAKSRHFESIFTTNTNPLTQQLADVYGYKTLLEDQVNQYVAKDNTRPFGLAPDSQKSLLQIKWLA